MRFVLRDIERAVCQRFRLTPEDLRGPSRKRRIARPRQIAMYLAREMTTASLPQIGTHFGGRDHTTILWGVRKIAAMMKAGGRMPAYLGEVRAILETLTPVKQSMAASVAVFAAVDDAAPASHVPLILSLSKDTQPAPVPTQTLRSFDELRTQGEGMRDGEAQVSDARGVDDQSEARLPRVRVSALVGEVPVAGSRASEGRRGPST